MRILLTGAPGSGKSTLLKHLKGCYHITPDYARVIIEQEKIFPWENHLIFQQRWLETMMDSYTRNTERTIFQYGFLDIIVYFIWRDGLNYKIPQQFIKIAEENRYDVILFNEMIPQKFYKYDESRTMSYEQTKMINDLTYNIYSKYYNRIITIPYLPEHERARYFNNVLVNNLISY